MDDGDDYDVSIRAVDHSVVSDEYLSHVFPIPFGNSATGVGKTGDAFDGFLDPIDKSSCINSRITCDMRLNFSNVKPRRG